jgi:diguanylate cyclase (GGDEF)-like protein
MEERDERELKALDQILKELNRRPDDYAVYEPFVQSLLPHVLELNKAHIFIFDKKGNSVKEYIHGFTEADLKMLNARGIIRETREDLLKQDHVVIVNDAQSDPRSNAEIARELDVGSYANLIFHEFKEVYGYLHICRSLKDIQSGKLSRFSEENELFLDVLGRTIAIALRNQRMYEQLNKEATIDYLTNLPNRRTFYRTLDQKLIEARRKDEPLSVAMSDIDHFKNFVDTYQHSEGSKLIFSLGQLMRSNIRDEYMVSNYAGDEFIFLMPGTDSTEAKYVTDKLGLIIAEHPFKTINPSTGTQETYRMTCSFGIADTSSAQNSKELIAKVDKALFTAKEQGRNRSLVYKE